jgi:hypothetical protein
MYVCIRVGHKAGPCTATFNDLLISIEYLNTLEKSKTLKIKF